MSPTGAWTLALSASRGPGSCAVRTALGVVRAARAAGPAALPATADALVRDLGGRPADVGVVLVDLGPGSYTGLRSSLAFTRVLHRFGGCTVGGCTSLELIAAAAAREGLEETLLRPLLDLRRGRCVWGRVRVGEVVELLDGPRCTSVGDALRDVVTHETLLAEPDASGMLPRSGPPAAPIPDYGAIDLLAAIVRPRPLEEREISPIYSMGSYADASSARKP